MSEAVVAAMDGIYSQMHNIKPPIMHDFLGPIPLSISGSPSTNDASTSPSPGVDSEDVNIDPSLAVYPEDASMPKVEHCSGKKIKSRRPKKEALKAAEDEALRHAEIVNLFQQKWEQDKIARDEHSQRQERATVAIESLVSHFIKASNGSGQDSE